MAGKLAAVWAPEVKPSWRRSARAAALIQAALAHLKSRGFRIAQAVLDESAGPQAGRDLTRGGMPCVTELLYLERDTATALPGLSISPVQVDGAAAKSRPGESSFSSSAAFEWQPFEPALEPEFRAVLQATYSGSLDMPELEGARSLDDVMEGYHAAHRFAADRWQLGRVRDKPDAAAVLLLAENPVRNSWEVVYLGLTPAARGRGLGRAALGHAIELAKGHVPLLELAVDRRNTPAVKLYKTTGFALRERRTVHLAVL
jgi:ribosomal protein S18 acetylase RimI-like enzyme